MGWMACCMTGRTRRPTHNPRYPHVPKPVLPASYSIPARCHGAGLVVTAAMKSPLALPTQEQACGFPLQ